MDSPGAVGRRRGTTRVNAEDQALDQIAKEVSAFFFCLKFSVISFKVTQNPFLYLMLYILVVSCYN